MFVLHLLCFFAAALTAAYYFRSTLPDTIPFTFCGLGLFLYPLAFLDALSAIDLIAVILFFGIVGFFFVEYRKNGAKALWKRLSPILCDARFWAFLLLAIILFCLVQFRQILEWDAYNFWAPDIKSLFVHDGFAAKYCNVAPEFGDYPPVMQLLLWWFLHLAGEWQEGVIFGGYVVFGASLLFRLAGQFRIKNQLLQFPLALGLGLLALLLPGIADTSWYRALYMDPVMAFLFGTLLCLTVQKDDGSDHHLREVSFLVFLSFLTLTKSIGFLWALFAIIFYLLWRYKERHTLRFTTIATGFVAATYGSWAFYCGVMERTTSLTTSLAPQWLTRVQEISQGTFFSSGNNAGYISSFLKAFFTESVHRAATVAIDLTPFLLFILIFVFIFALGRWQLISGNQQKKLVFYCLFVLIFTYLMLLTAHLTIFYHETGYLVPTKMVEQMMRYGIPANIGLMMMMLSFLAKAAPPQKHLLAPKIMKALAVLMILCCTGWGAMLDGFIFGHDKLNEQRIALRDQTLTAYAGYINKATAISPDDPQARILFCTTENDDFVGKSPIVIYAISPISMMYTILPQEDGYDTLIATIEESHAGYIYINDCDEATKTQIETAMLRGATINIKTLYRITTTEDGSFTLSTVE